MSGFFMAGEVKTRPGVYNRYENVGTSSVGASDGITAAVFKANWGPLGKVVSVSKDDYIATYGTAFTTDVLTQVFEGGAKTIRGVRLGSSGTKGTITLKDTQTTPANAIVLTTKYESDRAFQVLIRTALGDSSTKEFVTYEGNALVEKIQFPVSAAGEVDALVSAGADSTIFDLKKAADYGGNGVVATLAQSPITVGTNPVVTNADYSAAFVLLEPYKWNSICTDSEDVAVHALLDAYIARVFEGGKNGFAVFGEPISVALATRESHAAAFNRFNDIYVGGGWKAGSVLYDGYKAAARIAGLVAYTSSNKSITHAVITGATDVAEMLTSPQYDQTIKNGMVTFSTSSDGTVWVESGVTTLVAPTGEDDAGWKKIKRCKVRFELFDRSNATVEPLIGKVNNDSDGQATVLKALKGVLNDMIAEGGKILRTATVALSSASADSAYFEFSVDDIDTLEKAYLAFKFRYKSAA